MTIRGINFADLSLMDAIDLAVIIEEEARDRYEEFADQMKLHHTAIAAAFFARMAQMEEKHRLLLAGRRAYTFGNAPTRVNREMVFDVEAPDYDEARTSMTERDALEAALRSETKAHAFFANALPSLSDSEVKRLFEELRDEEVQHQTWIKLEIDRLPLVREPEGDVSDEPTAQ